MITYDLSNGLDIVRERLGTSVIQTQHHIPGVDFAPLTNDAPEMAEVKLANTRLVELKEAGRTLVALTMNTTKNDVTLFGMSWGANCEHPIGESMIANIAHRLPESEIVSWNSFGRGNEHPSSRLDPKAIRHASQTGSFDLVGREYGRRLAPLLEGKKNVDLIGVSEGGRIVLSAAAYLGRKVRNVVLLDSPGTLGLGYFRYSSQFLSEREHSDAYVSASRDLQIKSFVPEHQDPKVRWRAIWEDVRRGILFDHYYRSPKALGMNGLADDLERAAPHINGKLAFILPIHTAVNDPVEVRRAMGNVADLYPSLDAEIWSFPGSHAIINAGNMVEATLLAYAMQH